MSFLKKLLVTAAFSAAMFVNAAYAENVKIALVVKSLGNGFFDAANKGAEEAAKELGDVDVIYTGPTKATAEAQIEVINSLIAQKVNAIAVSANDADALVPVLKKAMDRGITVISWDSGVAKEGRQLHLNPSDTNLIGETIIKLAADYLPEGGDVAILSASSTATNQNAWIEAAKKVLPENFFSAVLAARIWTSKLDRRLAICASARSMRGSSPAGGPSFRISATTVSASVPRPADHRQRASCSPKSRLSG